MGFWTSFVDKTSSLALVRDQVLWGFFQNKAKSKPSGANNCRMYFGFDPIPKPCAQNELIVPQIPELLAWLG